MQTAEIVKHRQAAARVMIILTTVTPTAGCGGAAVLHHPQESLVEVPLGAFRVPLAPRSHRPSDDDHRHALLLRFQLCAVVSSEREGAMLQRIKTHEVRLRDDVISACRLASMDELSEPSLGTLKARLTKAIARHFDARYVRRVVMSNVLFEPI